MDCRHHLRFNGAVDTRRGHQDKAQRKADAPAPRQPLASRRSDQADARVHLGGGRAERRVTRHGPNAGTRRRGDGEQRTAPHLMFISTRTSHGDGHPDAQSRAQEGQHACRAPSGGGRASRQQRRRSN